MSILKQKKMKSIYKRIAAAPIIAVVVSMLFSNCTKLDVIPADRFTVDNFFKNKEEAVSGLASTYIGLRGLFDIYANGGLYSIDEYQGGNMATPVRDGFGWGDGNGIHQRLYKLQVNYNDNYYETITWNWLFQNIGSANWYIDAINSSSLPGKDSLLAEARMNRALFHYWALSYFGNIPYVDTYDASGTSLPEQRKQPYVYEQLVSEINACIPLLNSEVNPTTAGRWSKWGAYALLARLYLNAQIFKSESTDAATWKDPEWDKCIAACDAVINAQKYILEPQYFSNFTYNNETSRENIFTVPFDARYGTGLFIAVTHLHPGMMAKYGLPAGSAWNGVVITPDFFSSFDQDDQRFKNGIVYGPQVNPNGTPILDGYGNPLNLRATGFTFDAKDYDGARLTKYTYESGGNPFGMNNDFALFRYADILMMKAECLYRKGNAGDAVALINDVRKRSFATPKPLSAGDLTDARLLLEERQEFFGEMRARMDARRFNQLSKGVRWEKPAYPTNDADILPIPQTALRANPNLKQNPGSIYANMN
ncbi:MAG: RagB/SusD family nutrient uptake outer membrane protein [Chitinophagaceae bacterium]|nr:MAG: RagB/SusD family nutrient uptake outer membrane protein [Chitinophagaceae bacterium]